MIVTKHTFVVAVTVASNHGSSSQPVKYVFRQQVQSISALKILCTKQTIVHVMILNTAQQK
jgi:hypothetical protein